MLRYKTKTRPGLVALYDIRPGNGAGQFLQPRGPHGAKAVTQELNTPENQWHNGLFTTSALSTITNIRLIVYINRVLVMIKFFKHLTLHNYRLILIQ